MKALLYKNVINKKILLQRRTKYDKSTKKFTMDIPHMTLVNSANEPGDDGKKDYDSTEILEKYKYHSFGTFTVDKISKLA